MSKRLLVLDDDHFSRVMLAAALRAQDYDVLEAASAAEALQRAAACRVDLVIVGLTAGAREEIEALASLQARRRTPSIALTNGADPAQMRTARRYGAVGQIEKPADIKGLLALIDQVLGTAPA